MFTPAFTSNIHPTVKGTWCWHLLGSIMYPDYKIIREPNALPNTIILTLQYESPKNGHKIQSARIPTPATNSQLLKAKIKLLFWMHKQEGAATMKTAYKDIDTNTQFTLPGKTEKFTKKNPFTAIDEQGDFRSFDANDEITTLGLTDDQYWNATIKKLKIDPFLDIMKPKTC